MDDTDRNLLTAIQACLPADERPFDVLARRLDITPEETVGRVQRMVTYGLIRRLGPIFDSRSLGYVSTLVAAKVPPDRLADVAARVTRLSGVTHNYERQHAYNLWFTLTSPSAAALEETLASLRRETDIADVHSLPAETVYKIRVQFDLTGEGPPPDAAPAGSAAASPPPPLTDEQKALVRLLQDGVPAEAEPFAPIAARLGRPVTEVVEQVRVWLASGVIRRMGAVVRHRELGFHANGMAVFRVPPDVVDAAGRRLAECPAISHCYRRPPLPDFAFNLFAMTHGQSEDEVRRTVAREAEALNPIGPPHPPYEHDVLFSTTEFKKVSMRYFVEDEPA